MSVHTEYARHGTLVKQLNALLQALHIPIPLEAPTELTPSLLIAILESLLSTRIPKDTLHHDREIMNLQNTKVFLGVLETDILKMDVGLSNLDPRRLANGELEECAYVGELLCWVGRRLGHTSSDDPFEMIDDVPAMARREDAYSPSTSTATRKTFTTSTFSMHRHSDSNTSVDSFRPSTPTSHSTPRPTSRPRCIHEIPSPSVILSPKLDSSFDVGPSVFDSPESPSPRKQAVRYTGYISPVDEELELLSFERSRSMSMSSRKTADDSLDTQSESAYSLLALRESRAHTLALYQERARLLEELARLESEQLNRLER
ncbi:hypothetical protein D9615_000805 [Tricholomella constricta]|uniref:DUF5745 domain-containing protein n=1 Tax=Tricholomella constricta TaxID=117010 RepID=A0A8H5HRM0_9AGAR|nr:hypothetical protein D9615_000805 [Tricholomella constricta]